MEAGAEPSAALKTGSGLPETVERRHTVRLRPSRTFPWFPGCALFLMTLALAPGCQKAPPPQPPAPENAGAAADASRPEQPDQEGGTPMTFRITS